MRCQRGKRSSGAGAWQPGHSWHFGQYWGHAVAAGQRFELFSRQRLDLYNAAGFVASYDSTDAALAAIGAEVWAPADGPPRQLVEPEPEPTAADDDGWLDNFFGTHTATA